MKCKMELSVSIKGEGMITERCNTHLIQGDDVSFSTVYNAVNFACNKWRFLSDFACKKCRFSSEFSKTTFSLHLQICNNIYQYLVDGFPKPIIYKTSSFWIMNILKLDQVSRLSITSQ
jgi:hypothetical protein